MPGKEILLKDIFISYSSRDAAIINRLAGKLNDNNLTVFLAPSDIQAGDEFISEIEKGLQTSQVVAVFISPSSLNSYWVKKEWSGRLVQMSEDKTLKLIPVLLPGVNDQDIPLTLRDLHHLDFRQSDLNDPGQFEARATELIQSLKRELPPPGVTTIGVPFVIFAMTKSEAEEMANETIFQNKLATLADKELFLILKNRVDYDLDQFLEFYGDARDGWRPPLANPPRLPAPITIRNNIELIIGRINANYRSTPSEPMVRPQFFSEDFLTNETDWRQRTWVHLKNLGCVLVIDVFSLCHPVLRNRLDLSGFGTVDNVSIVVLSPMRKGDPPMSEIMENEIGERLQLAFRRYNEDLDLLCEFGVGNVRALNRWLYSTLPETIKAVQQTRPSPLRRRLLREQQGGKPPTGIDSLWSRPA